MSLAQFLSAYLNLNLLLLIGFAGLGLAAFSVKILRWRWSSRSELKLHYAALTLIIALSGLHLFLPKSEVFKPVAKVWTADTIKNFSRTYARGDSGGYLSVQMPYGESILQADRMASAGIVLGFLLILISGRFILRDLWRLRQLRRQSYIIRRHGRVSIYANEHVQVPFSYWWPGQINVVLPATLLSHHREYKIALAHEIQHHRAGDTQWIYILWILKWICVWNPVIYFWNRWISELQELACDETLVDRQKVDSQAYARCLLKVAQTASDQTYKPVCATGLTLLIEGHFLKRRIEKMLTQPTTLNGRAVSMVLGAALALVMGAAAFASNGLVQDRRVSLSQAQAMAAKVPVSPDGFPVVVNDLVLKQLNRYIGTPEGREFIRSSLQRMPNYKSTIVKYIEKYSAPEALLAVPVAESGYQNLEEKHNVYNAAGLWQFIRSTARHFGLRVDDEKDERLNVALSSDAAVRYLMMNYLQFKDWHLSVLAYNMGEKAVQNAIQKTGVRDAWYLIRNGYEGDKDYLPKVMAALIIMNNPEALE